MKTSYIIQIILLLLISQFTLAQNGVIKGRIYDAVSNEPLPYVSVLVNGTTIGTVSDEKGDFLIKDLNPGYIQIAASFVGYEKYISADVLISNSNQAYIELPMQPTNVQLDNIVVTTSKFEKKAESPVSLRKISVSEIEYNPGSNRDISKVIQSFPGVASTPSFRNDVIIRGGGPSESRFYLDGIEIPNLNHFATQGASGGAVGIINADFINSVQFYSGAFPANRGNALSGVFEFEQINANTEKIKFRGSVGASEIAATIDGPISKDVALVFSVRRSYLQFLFAALKLPFLPTFTDYQFKTHFHLGEKNELTLVGIGALDFNKLNTGISNPNEKQQYILSYLPVNEQWNYAIGAVYKHFQKHSYQTVVFSRNMLNNESYKYPENDETKNKTLDYKSQEIENKIRFENTSNFGLYKLNFGLSGEYAKYNNYTNQLLYLNNQLTDITYKSEFDLFKWGLFAQISKSALNNRLTLSLGIRFDGNNYSSSMSNLFEQFSPRFSASYALSQKFNLNFNTGIYYQLPSYTTLGYSDNSGELVNKNNHVKYIKVEHLIAGFEYKPQDYSQYTLEFFYKNYSNYPFSLRDQISLANRSADFGTIGDEPVVSTGKGRAYGFEVMTRYKLNNGFNMIVSYTFVRSEFNDINSVYIPSSWDSRHLITASFSKQFKNNWNIGAKWRFAGGLPYTPYNLLTSSLKKAWDTQGKAFLDFSQINTKRFNIFHQLDIRIDKRYYFQKWSLMFYIDIQNIYNFKSQQADIIVREKNLDGTYQIAGTDEEQQYVLKALKNDSGTILPTIGIMIQF